jgi:hypothetical protein
MRSLAICLDVDPHIGETVFVVVRFTVVCPLFVMNARHHRCVAVQSNLKVRHVADHYVHARFSVTSDIPRFTKCGFVLYGNDEIIGQ